MLKTWVVLPQKQVELFKQAARQLKRAEHIPHHLALDKIAQSHGFQHWKHVCLCREETEVTERALQAGLVVTFDFSENDAIASHARDPKCPFVEDPIAPLLCRAQLFELYADSEDYDANDEPIGKSMRETTTPEDLEEFFESEVEGLFYYRFTGDRIPKTLKQALKLVDKYSFWPPRMLWLNGQFHNTFDMPAFHEGQVMGFRASAGPELTRYGFFQDESHDAPGRQVVDRLKDVVLGAYLPTRTQRVTTSISSYRLKEVMENLLGTYIGNGECIQAMQEAGFKVKPYGEGSPNAAFNLSKREFKALEQAAMQAVQGRKV